MADLDVLGILGIVMLVVSGMFVFFGLPIIAFLLKDRLWFWPRQKWKIQIYEAEIKEFPTDEQIPLIGADGKPVYDTRGNAVTNPVMEKRIILTSEKPILDTLCWEIKQKIIPWLWVNRGMLKGFKLDMTYLAYVAPNDKGEKIIRVAQLAKGVWEGGSFYPLGDPDVTMFDKRHAIFTHKIDPDTIKQSISAISHRCWVDVNRNMARKDEDMLMKILQMMAPVIIVVLVLIVAIFAFDFSSKSMDKASGMWAANARQCALGYNIEQQQAQQAATNATATPAGGVKLPFG